MPQRRIAHYDCVQHSVRVKGELILAEDSSLFGPANRTYDRFDLPGEDLH